MEVKSKLRGSYGSKKYASVEVASTKAFIGVSTAACIKTPIEFTSKEAWAEARGRSI